MLGRKKSSGDSAGGYQEWAEYLDSWSRSEDPDGSALVPINPEDFPVDAWNRLVNRFNTAIVTRQQAWQTSLNRSLGSAADDFTFGRALQQGRAGAVAIRALASDPRLPVELRTKLTDTFDKDLAHLQERFEEDTARQRGRGNSARFVEARLRTLKDNPLTAVTTRALAEQTAAEAGGRKKAGGPVPGTPGAPGTPSPPGPGYPLPDEGARRKIIRP